MRIGKLQLIGLLAGAVLLGGMASVTAQESPSDEAPAKRMDKRGHKIARHAIRSEAVVPGDEEGSFRTIRHDRGELAAVDGSTLTIDEADGTSVEVVVNDETSLSRDGEDATLGDLVVGDHVFAFRYDDGDGFVTKAVKAISAERYAEMEARREACRENPEECKQRFRERRRGGAGGPASFDVPADVLGV